VLASVAAGGVAGNGGSFNASVGGPQGLVVFYSSATNLAGLDTNGAVADIFVAEFPFVACDASAGMDQTVDEGDLVTLEGSSLGVTPTYHWTQLAGTAVVLSDPNAKRPTLVAPMVELGGETLTFQLVVSCGEDFSDPDIVNVTVKNINHAPLADAGADFVVGEGSSAMLDGSGSFDPDGDEVTYLWTQLVGPMVSMSQATTAFATFFAPSVGPGGETLLFELLVSDGDLSHADTLEVFISNVNIRPVAQAGPDQVVPEESLVQLDGTGSFDADGENLTFSWAQVAGPSVILDLSDPSRPSFLGPQVGREGAMLMFELVVNDGIDASDADTVSVVVLDSNTPPDCSGARGQVIWPPNHSLVPVGIEGVVDADDPNSVTILVVGVSQDEPPGAGIPGDTSPDAVLLDGQLYLRAERLGQGDGRVYHVQFIATDGSGETCTGTAVFTVPLNKKIPAVDGGALYDSFTG